MSIFVVSTNAAPIEKGQPLRPAFGPFVDADVAKAMIAASLPAGKYFLVTGGDVIGGVEKQAPVIKDLPVPQAE